MVSMISSLPTASKLNQIPTLSYTRNSLFDSIPEAWITNSIEMIFPLPLFFVVTKYQRSRGEESRIFYSFFSKKDSFVAWRHSTWNGDEISVGIGERMEGVWRSLPHNGDLTTRKSFFPVCTLFSFQSGSRRRAACDSIHFVDNILLLSRKIGAFNFIKLTVVWKVKNRTFFCHTRVVFSCFAVEE